MYSEKQVLLVEVVPRLGHVAIHHWRGRPEDEPYDPFSERIRDALLARSSYGLPVVQQASGLEVATQSQPISRALVHQVEA